MLEPNLTLRLSVLFVARFLTPCNDDDKCEWEDDPDRYMTSRRWYPTLETLEDGSAIIVSGLSRASVRWEMAAFPSVSLIVVFLPCSPRLRSEGARGEDT